MSRVLRLLLGCVFSVATAWVVCPDNLVQSGIANDLAKISDMVSWNGGYETIQGVCGEYHLLVQTDGIYDTRMRIYEKTPEEIVIVFRPTQQTKESGDIHVDRVLVPCRLFPNCSGLVNDRFQQAVIDLVHKIPPCLLEDRVKGRNVYLTGHSLGGSLQLAMGIFLWKHLGTLPVMSLGLAGPFIGDTNFTQTYQEPLKKLLGDKWWQVESMNRYNTMEVDTTVEGYQVDRSPLLDIQQDAICRLSVDKLWDSYGMHDLRNYQTGLRGSLC